MGYGSNEYRVCIIGVGELIYGKLEMVVFRYFFIIDYGYFCRIFFVIFLRFLNYSFNIFFMFLCFLKILGRSFRFVEDVLKSYIYFYFGYNFGKFCCDCYILFININFRT